MKKPTPNQIRNLRAELDLTTDALAKVIDKEFTDIAGRTIRAWEQGARTDIKRWYVFFLKILVERKKNG